MEYELRNPAGISGVVDAKTPLFADNNQFIRVRRVLGTMGLLLPRTACTPIRQRACALTGFATLATRNFPRIFSNIIRPFLTLFVCTPTTRATSKKSTRPVLGIARTPMVRSKACIPVRAYRAGRREIRSKNSWYCKLSTTVPTGSNGGGLCMWIVVPGPTVISTPTSTDVRGPQRTRLCPYLGHRNCTP